MLTELATITPARYREMSDRVRAVALRSLDEAKRLKDEAAALYESTDNLWMHSMMLLEEGVIPTEQIVNTTGPLVSNLFKEQERLMQLSWRFARISMNDAKQIAPYLKSR